MDWFDYVIRLIVFVCLAMAGVVLAAIVTGAGLMAAGTSLDEVRTIMGGDMEYISPSVIRFMLVVQHIFAFIMPAIAFGLIYFRSNFLTAFNLKWLPSFTLVLLGISFIAASYPLVNLSYLANQAIDLPIWSRMFEAQAEDTLKAVMKMDTIWVFIINFILIAVIPGIGEELVFRGIIQKQLGLAFKSQVAGIWLAAIIFSAIHLQFEGFFPRLVLGAVLGYLYMWTKNLWVPIIAHMINNGIQVFFIYSMGVDIDEFEEAGSQELQWWMIILSVVAMYFFHNLILKKKTTEHA